MSFLQMSLAGAVMILVITILRALAIDRVPKLKVIDPKADPRLMGAPGTPARRR